MATRTDVAAFTATRTAPWWSWTQLRNDRNFLGVWFMLPAAAFLVLFLTYPLGLGVWLSFTDTKIGRDGVFIGAENFVWLADDPLFWLAVFNTLLYTVVASVFKFGIGLYLALLLNNRMPLKAFLRAIILMPFIVPTVLSAIAFWWIFDSQFSVISWALRELVVHDPEAVRAFLEEHNDDVSARVRREVDNKLTTGLKNPPRPT